MGRANFLSAITARMTTVCILLAALLLGACSNVEPWVKPYERANLATEIMKSDRNPVSDAYMNHVYEAREGARGASGSSGGGCGCN